MRDCACKAFPLTMHMHATKQPPSVHLCLPSLIQSLLSKDNKASLYCPANQSLHSWRDLSMTQFIWFHPFSNALVLHSLHPLDIKYMKIKYAAGKQNLPCS